MWLLKIRIKHDCTIAKRCEKFGCTSYSLALSNWHDKDYEYTAQKHQIFGPNEMVQAFLWDLKKDTRIFNLKTKDSEVYLIEKRKEKDNPSSFYNTSLFFIKPGFVDMNGYETYEIASREKSYLEDYIKGVKTIKNAKVEVEYIKPYQVKNFLKKLNDKGNIVKRTVWELDQRLSEQLRTGNIEGDQWFRDFKDWLLIAFNNPYNFKHPNSELVLLDKNKEQIFSLIRNHLQIHYGVGVGETELELVREQLEENNYLEVVGIDINETFLELFLENLKSKEVEFPESKILFGGYNTTFQNTTLNDFIFPNSKSKHKVHICLGGTIGNFKHQEEIWKIFQRNTEKKDKLLLGFQLDTHIDNIFQKYKINRYYPNFILNYLDEEVQPEKIEWKLDRGIGTIIAHYKDIEVFRTRKYNLKDLKKELGKFDFSPIKEFVDEYKNSCIAIFERR